MESIGGYRILGELARGGFGVVFRAHDPALDRELAIKVVHTLGEEQAEALARFRREAQAMARLRHPNLVAVHAVGVHHGRPYLAMDLHRGGTLLERLRRGALPPEEVARLGAKLARALAHAHEQGVLHRDLKPSNVLLSERGEPVLTDFGLARMHGLQGRLTATGTALGTPAYMAPEQAAGEQQQIGPHTDVYGLGATLYHALTGGPPHGGQSAAEIMRAVLDAPVQPPSERVAVDPELERILLRCLAKQPGERYARAEQVARDLEEFLAPRRPPARRRALPLALGLAALVAGAGWLATAQRLGEMRGQLTGALDRARQEEARQAAMVGKWQQSLSQLERVKTRVAQAEQELAKHHAVSPDPELDMHITRMIRVTGRLQGALQGDPSVSVAITRRWAALSDTVQARLLEAEVLVLVGRPSEATPILDGIEEQRDALRPQEVVRLEATRALEYLHEGQMVRAGQAAQRAASLDKSCDALEPWEWGQLGTMLAQPCPEVSQAVLTHQINDLQLPDPQSFFQRGLLRGAKGELDGALADYDQALAGEPNLVPAQLNRAMALRGLNRPQDALNDLDDLRQRVASWPPTPDRDLMLAEIDHEAARSLYALDRNQEALEVCDAWLRDSPQDVNGLELRAMVRSALGEFDGARQDLAAAEEAAGAFPAVQVEVCYTRANVEQMAGDNAAARAALAKAQDLAAQLHDPAWDQRLSELEHTLSD